jgi:hypothetical protein
MLERLPTRILVRGLAEPDCDFFAQRHAPWPPHPSPGARGGRQIGRPLATEHPSPTDWFIEIFTLLQRSRHPNVPRLPHNLRDAPVSA